MIPQQDLTDIQIGLEENEQRTKHLNILYTDKGITVLQQRLKDFIALAIRKPKYPVKVQILGFGPAEFYNEDELLGRIKELSEILYIGSVILEDKQ